jgi:hypothetical protein
MMPASSSAGKLQANADGQIFTEAGNPDRYNLSQMLGSPTGTDSGIALDFHDA